MSDECTTVPARDLWRIEAIEGFVDSGGDGRLDSCGVPHGVTELCRDDVSATVGDCNGDWSETLSGDSSIRSGGSNGVVACSRSSSACCMASSISKADGPTSPDLSPGIAGRRAGERTFS